MRTLLIYLTFSLRAAYACAVAAVGLCDHVTARCALPPAAPRCRHALCCCAQSSQRESRVDQFLREGTADIYLANEDQWQRVVPIELFVQDGSHVRIMGQMALAASRSSFTSVQSRRMITRCWWVNTPTETALCVFARAEAEQLKGFVKIISFAMNQTLYFRVTSGISTCSGVL